MRAHWQAVCIHGCLQAASVFFYFELSLCCVESSFGHLLYTNRTGKKKSFSPFVTLFQLFPTPGSLCWRWLHYTARGHRRDILHHQQRPGKDLSSLLCCRLHKAFKQKDLEEILSVPLLKLLSAIWQHFSLHHNVFMISCLWVFQVKLTEKKVSHEEQIVLSTLSEGQWFGEKALWGWAGNSPKYFGSVCFWWRFRTRWQLILQHNSNITTNSVGWDGITTKVVQCWVHVFHSTDWSQNACCHI